MKYCVLTLTAILFLALLLFSTGCMMAPVVPPIGGMYTNIKAPIDLNSGDGKVIGPKKGEASSVAICGLVAFGDAGLHAAAENGNLTTINHVDYRFLNILMGAYSKYTTIVYGE